MNKRCRILLGLLLPIVSSFGLPPAQAQTLSRGPYLQTGTPTSVVIRWRTSTASNSRVRFGSSLSSLTGIVDVTTSTTEHVVKLTGLAPDTQYYYSVGSTTQVVSGGDSATFFRTAPTVGTRRPYRIWVLGDAGTKNSSQRSVRDAYNAFNGSRYTDLWLMLGDNAYTDGTDSDYQAAVFDMYPKWLRQSVLWPTLGNHDGHSSSSSSLSGPYYSIFTLPRAGESGGVHSGTEAYYSFDFGNIHFVCLNSTDVSRSTSGAMLTWLRQDLQNNTRDWTIAFWHHPPYSKGSHNSDSEGALVDMREHALPILESEGVDLVLGGHSHSYERSYLLDGHYGGSGSLTSAMKLDSGNGRIDGSGAYSKPTLGPGTHEGAVYVVAGSSGKTSGGSLDHPAMYVSMNTLGSLVIDVNGSQLTAQFLNSSGSVRDHFTIVKSGNPGPQAEFSASPTSGPAPLQVQFTNLSTGATSWAWDFDGNGTTDSTQQSPTYTYAATGTYTVRLTATSAAGSDVMTKTGYIVATSVSGATCGNGIREGTEVCDGAQLNGQTCQSQGFSGGTLTCRSTCAGFDTSGCTTSGTSAVDVRIGASTDDAEEIAAGDVYLASPDLEMVYETSSQIVGLRFAGVRIPRGARILNAYVQFRADESQSELTSLRIQGQAADNAGTFDKTIRGLSSRPRTTASVSWTPAAWSAGDAGTVQRTPNLAAVIQEIVNRSNWNSDNAVALVVTGTGHRTAVAYDTSAAGAPLLHVEFSAASGATCGNGIREGTEVCDGTQLNGQTCQSQGFSGGTLTCRSTCAGFDTSGCTMAAICGNGIREGTEVCDGAQLNGQTCQSQGFTGGTLTCRSTCAGFDTSGCTTSPICGNGIREGTEVCDGAQLNGQTCQSQGFTGGTLTCRSTCAGFDTSGCTTGGTSALDVRIGASADDAEEIPTGGVNLTSPDLQMVFEISSQTVGLRFAGVRIPRGARILSAHVQFRAVESRSELTQLRIQGQAADNAGTFVKTMRGISLRPRTTASVSWTPPAWSAGDVGTVQRTPNLAAVIQEIVDRSNWNSGNAVGLVVTGTGRRTAESYDASGAGAPLLHVEYAH